MSAMDWALALAHQGYAVFPVDPPGFSSTGSTDPKKQGKAPYLRLAPHWHQDATTDPETVRDWWVQRPDANVGIAARPSGLVIVDEDTPGALDQYLAEVGATMTPTMSVATGRDGGGTHHYYRVPPGLTFGDAKGALRDRGIDVKGAGYVVGPGSTHTSGRPYTVTSQKPLAEAPTWLADAVKARTASPAPAPAQFEQPVPYGYQLPDVIRAGGRDDACIGYVGHLAATGMSLEDAEFLLEHRWFPRVEQPPGDPFTLADARLKLHRNYQRFAAPTASVVPLDPDADPNGFTPGGSILDEPEQVPAIWGRGSHVLWAEGEAAMITSLTGVGKTTLVGLLIRGLLGLQPEVLGYPVQKATGRVLYLAMDRPRQITRALRRQMTEADRTPLDEGLVIRKGPMVRDLSERPELMRELATAAGASVVIVDSLKDAILGLSDDKTAAVYNRARQLCVQAGIEIVELHHMVKRGPEGKKPNTIADVYGSGWLTAGAGSVILLWGQPGDTDLELIHLKSPSGPVGPWDLQVDHRAGTVTRPLSVPYSDSLHHNTTHGLTAEAAAHGLHGRKPTDAEKERARRALDDMVTAGTARVEPGKRGGSAARYFEVTS